LRLISRRQLPKIRNLPYYLKKALQDLTGATDAQVKAVEDYITATSLALGIADDELRPALCQVT
jgi:hypothetical protein